MFGYEEHPYGFYTMAGNGTSTNEHFSPSFHLSQKNKHPYIIEYDWNMALLHAMF